MGALAITVLLLLAAFGIKALFVFSARNGLLGQFDHAREKRISPGGVPLQQLNSNGRFPALDWQIRAPAIFALIFCENTSRPDTNLVGFSFVCAWGASWNLIVLESLRAYAQSRWLSWLAIPGILIYNHSHAVCTPLYLIFRIAVATGEPVAPLDIEPLDIEPLGLAALPWTFVLGYIFPLTLMAWPRASARFKHTVAGCYQQWNLYISALHHAFVWYWATEEIRPQALAESLPSLDAAYMVTMAIAAAGHWIPLLCCCSATVRSRLFGSRMSSWMNFNSIFVPPSPFHPQRSETMADGGKWLLQWDNLIGTMATTVWAGSMYLDISHGSCSSTLLLRLLGYFVVAGPMGLPIGLLRERDYLAIA